MYTKGNVLWCVHLTRQVRMGCAAHVTRDKGVRLRTKVVLVKINAWSNYTVWMVPVLSKQSS
jgi:hypothetical protein